jgi:phosphatidylglycerophosphate synthase
MIFACGAGAALAGTSHVAGWPQRGCWLLAAVFIQLRLCSNMLDGMVAVEGRKGGPTGDLWNEAPDRASDAAIFIGAGYAAGSSLLLGFGAAVLAIFVAYVRALGASLGAGQIFSGPMAKPQRMFLLTVLCLVGTVFPVVAAGRAGDAISTPAVEFTLHDTYYIYSSPPAVPFSGTSFVLLAIVAGCIITSIRRLSKTAEYLRSKARP